MFGYSNELRSLTQVSVDRVLVLIFLTYILLKEFDGRIGICNASGLLYDLKLRVISLSSVGI